MKRERESYAMRVWVRDEKFDKFIKSTKSNAIIHHHVPYLFLSVEHRYKIELFFCLMKISFRFGSFMVLVSRT